LCRNARSQSRGLKTALTLFQFSLDFIADPQAIFAISEIATCKLSPHQRYNIFPHPLFAAHKFAGKTLEEVSLRAATARASGFRRSDLWSRPEFTFREIQFPGRSRGRD
ncbi:hypothetical protein WKW50_25115, partial [Ochrobactrum sp. GPK 3]